MSSDSEMSSIYQSFSDPEQGDFVDSEDEDDAVVYGQITPYQYEPLAEDDDKENGERKEETEKKTFLENTIDKMNHIKRPDQASGSLAPFCQFGNSAIES